MAYRSPCDRRCDCFNPVYVCSESSKEKVEQQRLLVR
jgi:hypothetical protein